MLAVVASANVPVPYVVVGVKSVILAEDHPHKLFKSASE